MLPVIFELLRCETSIQRNGPKSLRKLWVACVSIYIFYQSLGLYSASHIAPSQPSYISASLGPAVDPCSPRHGWLMLMFYVAWIWFWKKVGLHWLPPWCDLQRYLNFVHVGGAEDVHDKISPLRIFTQPQNFHQETLPILKQEALWNLRFVAQALAVLRMISPA